MTILNVLTTLAMGAALAAGANASAAPVFSNNAAPGDAFTNASGTNQGQAIAASGWYYNNVRAGATVGITTANARSGNGSAQFTSPANGKADIEYLQGGATFGGNNYATASMGSFGSLLGMSYDWFRDTDSTATANLHPSLRVLLDADGDLGTSDRGMLVFERAYNGVASTAGVWNSDTVGASTKLWNSGLGLHFAYDLNRNGYGYDSSLSDWQAFLPNAVIIGFSSGVGSGWNTFGGAVDNISWNIGGQLTSSNFEVRADDSAVPEPMTLALFGAGIVAAGLARRRRKA